MAKSLKLEFEQMASWPDEKLADFLEERIDVEKAKEEYREQYLEQFPEYKKEEGE